MPPAKQKRIRNQDTPSKTLHDFFNPTSSSVSLIQKSEHKHATAGGRSSRFQGKTGVASKSMAVQEVIIIGSDSDDDMPEIIEVTASVKRRKLSPRNSDDIHIPHTQTMSSNSYIAMHSKENGSAISTTQTSREMKREEPMFGTPLLLCSSPPSKSVEEVPKSAFAFEPPALLASTSTLATSTVTTVTTVTTVVEDIAEDKAQVDIDLTLDFWDDGDDERQDFIKAEPESGLENDVSDGNVVESSKPDVTDDWTNDMSFHEEDSQMQLYEDEETKPRPGIPSCPSTDVLKAEQIFSDAMKPSTTSNAPNASSFLMSSFKEKEAWKEADVAEDRSFRATSTSRRKAPFYKVLQGMPIAVDAFKYGAIPNVTAYFLTHAHSDHYTNLSSSWKNGPIYCSSATANLIIHMLRVDPKWVRPLPMDVPVVIPDTGGVEVTLIDANHCPGSCLFFFEGKQSVDAGDSNFKSKYVKDSAGKGQGRIWRYLHCGDFRAEPRHVLHPAVKGKRIDHVYLDTTYLDPKYTFPPQPLVISACADLVKNLILGEGEGTTDGGSGSSMLSWLGPVTGKGKKKEREESKPLIVVGTYSIGKERIVKAIAKALNTKVYCDARKASILRCIADPELDALLTNDPKESIVHLVPLATIATDRLKIYLERFDGMYGRVIGFRPTGWTYTQAAGTDLSPSIPAILFKSSQSTFSHKDLKPSPKSPPQIQLYPVPYSEHSSFNELTCFAMSFTWTKMIATVNVGSEGSRAKMAGWFAKWEKERRKRGKDEVVEYRHEEYW